MLSKTIKHQQNFSNTIKTIIRNTQKKPLVVTGPSGVGKSTFVDKLILESYPGLFKQTVSYTSRQPRPQEKNGIDYYFVSIQEFEQKIQNNIFIEHQNHYNTYYGSSKEEIVNIIEKYNKIPVFVIDIKGAQRVIDEIQDINKIFIKPESIETLVKRLQHRGTESQEKVKLRIEKAYKEIEQAKEIYTDNEMIINAEFQSSYNNFLDKIQSLYFQQESQQQSNIINQQQYSQQKNQQYEHI